MPKLRNSSKEDSNPGSLDCESSILPLSYRAPLVFSAELLFESVHFIFCFLTCCDSRNVLHFYLVQLYLKLTEHYIFYVECMYLLTLLYSASSVLTLTAPAAQLLSPHAVLSSVSLTFSSKDDFVHFVTLSMYCILGRPLLLFPDIIPRMQVFTRLYVPHA